jgi:hypothetical protein
MKKTFAFLGAIALVGCSHQQPMVSVSAPFDLGQTMQLMAPGKNTIKGYAAVTQPNGNVFNCAGQTVTLLPATDYAVERVTRLYGNPDNGYRPVTKQITFANTPVEYTDLRKKTTCDEQGHFRFDNVGDGNFYVSADVIWVFTYGPYKATEGGTLIQRVALKKGQTRDVILSR